jgi:oligopeptidase B
VRAAGSVKADSKPLLVKANLGAGHGGASGRYDRWKEIAFEHAFMVSHVPDARLTP